METLSIPTEEDLAQLASEHLAASDAANALVTESVGLPSLREQALLDGDRVALSKIRHRALELAMEIPLANIRTAQAAVAYWSARHEVARFHRDQTRDRAYATGPNFEDGFPEGVRANIEATATYENWQLEVHQTTIALGAAKRSLDLALATAGRAE